MQVHCSEHGKSIEERNNGKRRKRKQKTHTQSLLNPDEQIVGEELVLKRKSSFRVGHTDKAPLSSTVTKSFFSAAEKKEQDNVLRRQSNKDLHFHSHGARCSGSGFGIGDPTPPPQSCKWMFWWVLLTSTPRPQFQFTNPTSLLSVPPSPTNNSGHKSNPSSSFRPQPISAAAAADAAVTATAAGGNCSSSPSKSSKCGGATY